MTADEVINLVYDADCRARQAGLALAVAVADGKPTTTKRRDYIAALNALGRARDDAYEWANEKTPVVAGASSEIATVNNGGIVA